MTAFSDKDRLRELFEEEQQRRRFGRYHHVGRHDYGLSSRFESHRLRRKRILRRLLVLLLLLLMFITGGFGALPDNPITTMFRDEIAEILPAPYLEHFNSFLG